MIMPPMISLRRGTVLDVVSERPGAVEVSVRIPGEAGPAQAVAYPALVGPVAPGDVVLLNTTAMALGLGTGGVHFVVAVEGREGGDPDPAAGRTMKLRYTPHQLQVMAAEEEGSPHRPRLREASELDGTPVVWVPLHSMVAPAVEIGRAHV